MESSVVEPCTLESDLSKSALYYWWSPGQEADLSELLIGQDLSHRITFEWNLYQWIEIPGNSQGDEQPVD